MPAYGNPKTSGFHDVSPVHPQTRNRCPAARTQPNDHSAILAPTEVIIPTLSSRVKQRRLDVCFRVYAAFKIVFVRIASGTGEAKILSYCFAAGRLGNNVIEFHRHYDDHLRLTVFAALLRPVDNQLSYSNWNECHMLHHEFQVRLNVMTTLLHQHQCLAS